MYNMLQSELNEIKLNNVKQHLEKGLDTGAAPMVTVGMDMDMNTYVCT